MSLLNWLADAGYWVAKEKAQLVQQFIRYLGYLNSKGTESLGQEKVRGI